MVIPEMCWKCWSVNELVPVHCNYHLIFVISNGVIVHVDKQNAHYRHLSARQTIDLGHNTIQCITQGGPKSKATFKNINVILVEPANEITYFVKV